MQPSLRRLDDHKVASKIIIRVNEDILLIIWHQSIFALYLQHTHCLIEVMKEKKVCFDPKKSIARAKREKNIGSHWSIKLAEKEYTWGTKLERIAIIRQGLPYTSIEVISKSANLPVKTMLHSLGVAQTTYNKRKRENHLLNSQNSELVLVLMELIEYGKEVFNGEVEKFHRWLRKPNISLGGAKPDSFFDSLTGIQIVKNALNRVEYGNFA